jgi:hypothetical protein
MPRIRWPAGAAGGSASLWASLPEFIAFLVRLCLYLLVTINNISYVNRPIAALQGTFSPFYNLWLQHPPRE